MHRQARTSVFDPCSVRISFQRRVSTFALCRKMHTGKVWAQPSSSAKPQDSKSSQDLHNGAGIHIIHALQAKQTAPVPHILPLYKPHNQSMYYYEEFTPPTAQDYSPTSLPSYRYKSTEQRAGRHGSFRRRDIAQCRRERGDPAARRARRNRDLRELPKSHPQDRPEAQLGNARFGFIVALLLVSRVTRPSPENPEVPKAV